MYYQNGWKATIDGKGTKIHRANYVLRALQIPAGKHTIEFKFEPQVVKTGSTIALMSSIGMFLLIGAGVYFVRKKKI
jgi:LPXTG-motif cell wall-anchored protein